jgi:hypothetical protein
MTKRFSGGSQTWNEPHFVVKGSNISSHREYGIGSWTEGDFKRLMGTSNNDDFFVRSIAGAAGR